MPKFSLAGLKDPVRRPRYIMWVFVGVVAFAAVMIAALGITSTNWFCVEGCHKVQDDTIIAFDDSAHANLACMSCHMPVGSDPVSFLFHKAEALGELYLTVTNQYRLPLNPESHLAMEREKFPDTQCMQCHSENRQTTPSRGIIIDHKIHAENDVTCTTCHNRTAHPEDFELTLAGNRKHDDFMEMDACFRCHSLEDEAQAPGECAACHPPDFELKPDSHREAGFYEKGGGSAGHAKLGSADFAKVEKAVQVSVEAAGGEGAKEGGHVRAMGEVSHCLTCHKERFCEDCHGVPMPHPSGFEDGHGKTGKENPKVCANCHGGKAGGTEFCNACHHKGSDVDKPWIPQHFLVVKEKGAASCFECHEPTYCAECHVRTIK